MGLLFMCKLVCALLILITTPVLATESKPSAELVKEYFMLAQKKYVVETGAAAFQKQYEQQVLDILKQKLKGKKFSPSQKAILQNKLAGIFRSLRAYFSWDAQEQSMLSYYVQGFSKEELEGVVAFFKTPVGKTYMEKTMLITAKAQSSLTEKGRDQLQEIFKRIDGLIVEVTESTSGDQKKKENSDKNEDITKNVK